MTRTTLESPLLAADSLLDDRQRRVVERVSQAERKGILALPTDAPLDPKRRRRVEATRDEMLQQPRAVEATWDQAVVGLQEISEIVANRRFDRAFLVGAGDSLAVMVAIRSLYERMLGIPCEPIQSLEFAYYRQHLVTPDSLVIALSSSGETTRTVEAVLVAQHVGALTIAVTNTPGSTLESESQRSLLIQATRVGWPTQSSTAAMALLMRLAVLTGIRKQAPDAEELAGELSEIPESMTAVLAGLDPIIARIAESEAHRSTYLFSAAGPTFAAAIVGAAKVKETTPDHAVEIQVEEYHHYNSQKSDEPLFLFAPTGPSVPRALDTGHDARRYGGQLYAFTTSGEHAFDDDANQVIELPPVSEELAPLLYVLPAQMIGYHLGMAKFAAAEAAEAAAAAQERQAPEAAGASGD
jgi:glucosamine--fructose-6-phosphate aminotransferase (isomerizing)